MKVDKSKYDNSWYKPGPIWKRALWFFLSPIIFRNPLFPFYGIKVYILKAFGANIGNHCVIKPGVNIKYPWFLKVGDYVWIGENAWIDNLAMVTIEDNVTISQGALLLTGNHNYKSEAFDLMVGEIHLKEGSWVGAKAIVGPGVTLEKHAVLSLGSRTAKDLSESGIYEGVPAVFVKKRILS